MSTVYILGAGASKGASPSGTSFPLTTEVLRVVREEVVTPLYALCCYLHRFAPVDAFAADSGKLRKAWDDLNIEELLSAVEFESRMTLSLSVGDAWQSYYGDSYQTRVRALMDERYGTWISTRYFAPNNADTFPFLHKNFLQIVQEELLEAISGTFHRLSAREEKSCLENLVPLFRPKDVIISLNYDLLLEACLRKRRPEDWCFQTGYAISPASNDAAKEFSFMGSAVGGHSIFKLLKLHGSCNWHVRYSRNGKVTVPQQYGAGFSVPNEVPDGFVVTDVYAPLQQKDGGGQFYRRLMTPPTTYKAENSFDGNFLLHSPGAAILATGSPTMWQTQRLFFRALEALKKAQRIVFIGYSVPAADSSIRMLLRTTADVANNLQQVVVADPDVRIARRVQRLYPHIPVEHYAGMEEFIAGHAGD